MRIGGTQIGQVRDHRDVVLVTLQRTEPLGHSDFRESPGLGGVKRVFGKSEATAQEEYAFGRRCCQITGISECFQEWKSKQRTTRSKK